MELYIDILKILLWNCALLRLCISLNPRKWAYKCQFHLKNAQLKKTNQLDESVPTNKEASINKEALINKEELINDEASINEKAEETSELS